METIVRLQFLKLACVLCQCFTITDAVRAVQLPSSVTAIEGWRAEFNCTTVDKTADEELFWAIKWDDGSFLMWYYLPAEVTINHEFFLRGMALTPISEPSLGDHGRYSTVHQRVTNTNGSLVDLCLLQIDDIRDEDQGKFHCVYRLKGGFQNLFALGQSNQAQLTVVVPPDGDAPSCSVSQIATGDPTLGGALVELSCISSIAIDPLPTITWISGQRELSSTISNANLYRYSLKEKDNGREFVCVVTHPSLTNPNRCSVLPLNESPNAVVTKENMVAAVGSNAVFKCIGSGIPYIVKYTWFVGESSFSHFNTNGVDTPEISFIGSEGSTLSLPNLKPSANNTKVTCEVSLPSGLSSNASAVILLRHSLPLSVIISPKRVRVFKDSEITFSCFAETEDKNQLHFSWYVDQSLVLFNTSVDNQPFKIKDMGRSGSVLLISKEQASAFDKDVRVTCEATSPTGSKTTDFGILISQQNTQLFIDITPKVVETNVDGEATFRCDTQPRVPTNATFLWLVQCEPSRQKDLTDFWSESGSKTITLSKLNHATQCDVTCSVSMPSGIAASATGLVIVHSPTFHTASIGEVNQPETRSTNWRLPGALGAGGVGIFLGILFCSMLLLLYSCAKSYSRYNKTGGTSRVQVSTPIYETINPQCGSRNQNAPELPLTCIRQCQQQSNATYNRPPIALPITMQVAMPVQRPGLQRVPSSESQVDSVASSISKDSLDFSGMNSSPSTATFGRESDSDDHEYESCEITTCV